MIVKIIFRHMEFSNSSQYSQVHPKLVSQNRESIGAPSPVEHNINKNLSKMVNNV